MPPCEVGPALFFSLLIITLLVRAGIHAQAQEGRLFAPLAFTKTYAMAAAAGLAITLVPVLMGYLIRGRIPREAANPLNPRADRALSAAAAAVLRFPKTTLAGGAAGPGGDHVSAAAHRQRVHAAARRGRPALHAHALPGLSAGKGASCCSRRPADQAQCPRWRASSARRAAPRPPPTRRRWKCSRPPSSSSRAAQWRAGMTPDRLVQELDRTVQVPGLSQHLGAADPQSHRHAGDRHQESGRRQGVRQHLAARSSGSRRPSSARSGTLPGVSSAFAERLTGGRYIDVQIDRAAAARYGLNIADVQSVVSAAIGGDDIGETVEGLQRFPISLRYPRELRDTVAEAARPAGADRARRADPPRRVAAIRISRRSADAQERERAALAAGSTSTCAAAHLSTAVARHAAGSGARGQAAAGLCSVLVGPVRIPGARGRRLKVVVPATLLIIFMLLYLTFRRLDEALLIMVTLPFALVGGFG